MDGLTIADMKIELDDKESWGFKECQRHNEVAEKQSSYWNLYI